MNLRRVFIALAIIAGGLALWFFASNSATRRTSLWRVVHYGCVPDQTLTGYPAPCLHVDLTRRFALVTAPDVEDELLLVPTVKVTGIEDPALLSPSLPDYWRLAWEMRKHLTVNSHPVPSNKIGLAVNSAYSRTQDQLHIHISCLRSSVFRHLQTLKLRAGVTWSTEEIGSRKFYDVIRLPGNTLTLHSPFQILASRVGSDPSIMARQTLVLAETTMADGTPAFFLLRQNYNMTKRTGGHGEELLDHRCQMLRGENSASH